MLEEWAPNRIFGSTLLKQVQVKPNTVQSYFSGLKSYHIDRQMSFQEFDSPCLALIIKEGKRLFPIKKRDRFPITKDILEKIMKEESLTVDDPNINTTFKVAWTGFMRMEEITYMATEAKQALFAETKAIRSDISFAKDNHYAILCLKRSKIDTKHTRI